MEDLPHPPRDDAEKSDLRAQSWTLSNYDEIRRGIEEVAKLLELRTRMGVRMEMPAQT